MTAIHAVGVDAPADASDAALREVLAAPLPDIPTEDCVPTIGLVLGAFLRPHLHGLHPFLVEQDLPASVDVRAVLPEGARIVRLHRRNDVHEVLASVKGCLIVVRSWRRTADVWASGSDRELVEELVKSIRDSVPKPPQERAVRVTFWHAGRQAVQRTRDLDVPSWEDVQHMYPSLVRRALDTVMNFRPSVTGSARLLLWHGPPGTGKTTAVRALCDAWREWSTVHVVSDPEQLLNNGDYMSRVLLDADDDSDDGEQTSWRLVVIEDAEDLLRRDARAKVGAALGRLLNTADGLLGQGTRTLLLLTTNERIDEMHPALLRPGRCLARIEFPPFDAAEASALLGARASGPMSLAEVMERRGELTRLQAVATPERPGQYL